MFTNPGDKIKSLSKFLFIAGAIFIAFYGVLCAIGLSQAVFGLPINIRIGTASRPVFYLVSIIKALWNMAILLLCCWIGCLLLYAIGEVVETRTEDSTTLRNLLVHMESTPDERERAKAVLNFFNNTGMSAERISSLLGYPQVEVEKILSQYKADEE